MSCTRSQIVSRAQAWVGLQEANGGHRVIVDTYNSHKPLARGYQLKYTDEWCSGFASAVAIACGATDIIPTEVGCGKHIAKFQSMGIWVEADDYVPAPGDYIFYDWKDDGKGENIDGASHVGIVENVENDAITVIEGNLSGGVHRRTIRVNGRFIRGYGVPRYDAEVEIAYRVFADGCWLSAEEGDYAGEMGKPISGLQVALPDGSKVTLCAHICGKSRDKWLPPVCKWDDTPDGYAGIFGRNMDCIAMKAQERRLRYRVHILGGKWLPWIEAYDLADYQNGFAGIYGKPIDAVQIQVAM